MLLTISFHPDIWPVRYDMFQNLSNTCKVAMTY